MHCFPFVCNNFVKRFSFSHEMLKRLIGKKKAQLLLCVWLSSQYMISLPHGFTTCMFPALCTEGKDKTIVAASLWT